MKSPPIRTTCARYKQAPAAGIEFDNLSGERDYAPRKAYGQSKLANYLFVRERARRMEGTRVTANALQPGVIMTNLGRYLPWYQIVTAKLFGWTFMKSVEAGASTQVYLATWPKLAGVSGLGRLHEAIDSVEQLLHFVMDQGEPIPPDTADLHRELSELYLEQGNQEVAAHHLQRGQELGEKAQLPVLRYRLCIAPARLKKTQGDLAGPLDLLDEAERLFIRTPLPDFSPISAMKARIWVAQGRLTEALEWAHARNLSDGDAPSYLREFEHITLAKVLIARYRSNQEDVAICDVLKLLERFLKAASFPSIRSSSRATNSSRPEPPATADRSVNSED